jgi:hypothetical protein
VILLQATLDLLLGALAGVAIALLEPPEQFICLPADLLEVIICEPAPPCAEFPAHLLPTPFEDVRVARVILLRLLHGASLLFFPISRM